MQHSYVYVINIMQFFTASSLNSQDMYVHVFHYLLLFTSNICILLTKIIENYVIIIILYC